MKFKVGDRVKWVGATFYGEWPYFGTIIEINTTVEYLYYVKWDNGTRMNYKENPALLELIQTETQEPVPGKFYRTRDGDKVFYVGKDNYGYFVYQNKSGDFYQYFTATEHVGGCVNMEDIIGEWVDEVVLPAMEIKQWAIVLTIDSNGHKRGEVMSTCIDKLFLEANFKQDLKLGVVALVELTGTLPERKI